MPWQFDLNSQVAADYCYDNVAEASATVADDNDDDDDGNDDDRATSAVIAVEEGGGGASDDVGDSVHVGDEIGGFCCDR